MGHLEQIILQNNGVCRGRGLVQQIFNRDLWFRFRQDFFSHYCIKVLKIPDISPTNEGKARGWINE